MTTTRYVLELVRLERLHQNRLKAEGRFEHTLADKDGYPDGLKLACILEEVAEVGKNLLARNGQHNDGDPTDEGLVEELTQVAALSVAWMECLLDAHEPAAEAAEAPAEKAPAEKAPAAGEAEVAAEPESEVAPEDDTTHHHLIYELDAAETAKRLGLPISWASRGGAV